MITSRPALPQPNPPLLAMLLIVLSLLLAACGSGDEQGGKRDKAVPVTVVAVAQEDVPYTLNAVGNVEPMASVEIKSRVGGIIEEQMVKNGQEVQQGDPLFRIDPRSFDLDVQEAQAQLDRDRAHLNKAREDLKRHAQLREMNVVAQELYDETFAEATALENTIRLNQAALGKARLDREYANITAPISGRVGIVQVNVGNVIKANDDRTLCVINQIRPINVAFSLPERFLGEIMSRMAGGPLSVSLTPSGDEQEHLPGELTAVDNAVDTDTGTIRLLATYANEENRLWPGQFARVDLTLRTLTRALLLPSRAVMEGVNGPYVYLVVPSDDPEGGVAQARDVTTSTLVGDRTVIEKGVQAGDLVVLDGQLALTTGTKVKIKKGKADTPAPQTAPAPTEGTAQ